MVTVTAGVPVTRRRTRRASGRTSEGRCAGRDCQWSRSPGPGPPPGPGPGPGVTVIVAGTVTRDRDSEHRDLPTVTDGDRD
jgi:hypothetical protein